MRGCGRPGCTEPAAAALGFDTFRRAVWLHPLDEPEATGRLCLRHADATRPPRGWRLFDYRQPESAVTELVPVGARDDFDDLLDARTPLLERAFRGVRAS
jgi:hypothetical protein